MHLHRTLYNLLLILSIILAIFLLYNSYQKKREIHEGFEQTESFILKTDESIYDDFYVEVYDEIMQPKKRAVEQTELIIETVPIDKEKSYILDIGSGTGSTVHYLTSLGYRVEGIDKSEEMVKKSIETDDGIYFIKQGDITNPMEYDHNIFTHIICSDFTIYEFKNKLSIFKNFYFWLQGKGFLIIHLVDRDKFIPIIPSVIDKDSQSLEDTKERITKTEIDYNGYKYTSLYDFSEKSNHIFHKETFVDKKTKHVRQNERTLYMEKHIEILKMLNKAGFITKGNIDLGKTSKHLKNQWLYILERTL